MKKLFNFSKRKKIIAHFGFLADTEVPLMHRILYLSLDEPTKRKVEKSWEENTSKDINAS